MMKTREYLVNIMRESGTSGKQVAQITIAPIRIYKMCLVADAFNPGQCMPAVKMVIQVKNPSPPGFDMDGPDRIKRVNPAVEISWCAYKIYG
jgi:hypothetical protein